MGMHVSIATQYFSLPPDPMAPPAPAPTMPNHDDKAGHKSAKDGAWDNGVNGKDLAGGNEAKYGGKAGHAGPKECVWDKGVNTHDHNHHTDGATPGGLLTIATTS